MVKAKDVILTLILATVSLLAFSTGASVVALVR